MTEDTITKKWRDRWVGRFIENDLWSGFITCPWCVGMWCAMGVVAARLTVPSLWDPVAHALAYSELTGLVATLEAESARAATGEKP